MRATPCFFVRSQLFLSFPNVSIKTPVTIQDRSGQCCSRANRWRPNRDARMDTRWFLWFWHRTCGTHTPDCWTLSIEFKYHTMVEWPQFITFASSRVHCLGTLRINVFKRSSWNPEVLPGRGVSLMSKWSSLKRENHFLDVISPMTLSSYTAHMFLADSSALAPLLNSKRRLCRKCSNFSTYHSIF